MTVANDARVSLLLADFANADATGKLNVIGGKWQVTSLLPTGLTQPMSLVVLIALPANHHGEQFAWGVSLHDEAGEVVSLPGPNGEPQAMRIQQVSKLETPDVRGVVLPSAHLPCSLQLVMNFPTGLLLSPGAYLWKVEIDGNSNPLWQVEFFVAGPPPRPVLG
ncbi:MAG: DUF6941 family protein [Acidimicrobiales bacterium]